MVVNYSNDPRSSEDMTRFIDYFFMCGLNVSEEPKLYKHFEEPSQGLKGRRIIPSVLCHFPNDISDNPWSSAELWRLCAPGGLSVHIGNSTPSVEPHFHSFAITREGGSKIYGHVLTFYEVCVNPDQQGKLADCLGLDRSDDSKKIFVQKCAGFITQLALINTCEKVLKSLYKSFVTNQSANVQPSNNALPIESYIYNLLYEVPQLTPGCSLKLSCMGHVDPVIVHQPGGSDLPLLDINLSTVYRLLGGAKNLMNLLTSLLYEHQILLVSEDSYKLSLVGEGITSLLFPFQWLVTYATVLPYEVAKHFFDAPVPYVIGVVVASDEKKLVRQAIEVNQCYVDLDEASVESPEDQPGFPNQAEIILKIEHVMEAYKNEINASKQKETTSTTSTSSSAPKNLSVSSENGNTSTGTNNNTSKDVAQSEESLTKLQANETVSRIADIARKAGVINSLEDIDSLHANVASNTKFGHRLQVNEAVFYEQKFNIAIRETLAASFLSIFSQYDKFVIHPNLDEEGSWSETQDNFDKTSFLSDQPESRLPFLFSFLETQIFASFVDNAILAHQTQQDGGNAKDPFLRLFDDRIEQSKIPPDHTKSPTTLDPPTPEGVFRTLSISSSHTITSPYVESWIKDAENAVEKRLSHVDMVSCLPHPVHVAIPEDTTGIPIMNAQGTFPVIRSVLLESEAFETKKHHLKRRDQSRAAFKKQTSVRASKWKKIQEARSKLLRQPSISEYSPELIAQTNWMFVEKLLKDVKSKTKKILVGKMGQEAIELGHDDVSVSDLEENTWIASLCDLLERVWSHGLLTNHKKGKSALWSHLLQYQVEEEEKARKKSFQRFGGSSPSLVNDAIDDDAHVSSPFNPVTSYYSLPRSFPRKKSKALRQQSEDRNSEISNSSSQQNIPLMEYTVITSLERIQAMREVQTEVGRSRAWIRLALEQKQLHTYLRELLTKNRLLDRMYKRYSLLQCEDEREQFLYHLLSLNAADFNCFTNSFPKTTIEYQVWIVPGRQFAGASQTSANVYMSICGEHCYTERIIVPKGCLEFTFKHQNLGVITTLTIGHDNAGMLPKWLLDDVIVQNKTTGQTCCFSCRRWLGKGVDDGSLERLLVAEVIPRKMDVLKFANNLSHSNSKRASPTSTIPELQELVGQAVNNIVKYYYKPARDRRLDVSPPPASFTRLLFNLVRSLESVFTHGLKTGRFIKRRLFALDVIGACFDYFRDNIKPSVPTIRFKPTNSPPTTFHTVAAGGDWFLGSRRSSAGFRMDKRPREGYDSRKDVNDVIKSEACIAKERVATARLCQLYQQIYTTSQHRMGKDDIFYLLMCVGIHEHSVALWLPKISEVARNRQDLYLDSAFLCDMSAVVFLGQVLNMLHDFEIPLDVSLLRGSDGIIGF
ncbi:unnamed protein product [Clavelina lepadiformis]|uniref:DENN domain-containing protein 5B n=1 Tax=Clavelina lepadiformis TaxID=159417 RepID=A0ABP0FVF0_CLALP